MKSEPSDAIVDIVGACIGFHALGIERFACSPLNVGGGTAKMAHGVLPVPAPATARLLQGAPTFSNGVQRELVTPTGAAIVATLCDSFGPQPPMTVSAIGYGAGAADLEGQPNVRAHHDRRLRGEVDCRAWTKKSPSSKPISMT